MNDPDEDYQPDTSIDEPFLPAGASTIAEPLPGELVPTIPFRLRELIPVVMSIATGITIIVASGSIRETQRADVGPAFWPVSVAWVMIIFAFLLLVVNVLLGRTSPSGPEQMSWWGTGRLTLTVGVLVGYLMLWNVQAFWLITWAATATLMLIYGLRSWKVLIGMPITIAGLIHFLFIVALGIPL